VSANNTARAANKEGASMTQTTKHYRIFTPDGEHIATVDPEHVKETLAAYNDRRELDIDGNPIGEYTAQPYDGDVAGSR
jgi:hypothetical protein